LEDEHYASSEVIKKKILNEHLLFLHRKFTVLQIIAFLRNLLHIYCTSLLQIKSDHLQLKHVRRFSRDNFPDRSKDNASWSTIIWNQLARVLRTHAFKVDIEHMFNTASSELDPNNNIVQSESQRKFYETIELKVSLQLIL